MTTESTGRDRISFKEVAKLANTPEPSGESSDTKSENSGMIDFAAIAAGETDPKSSAAGGAGRESQASAASVTPPVERNATAPRETPVTSTPRSVSTTPTLAGVEVTQPRPLPSSPGMPLLKLPFGSTSPTLMGVGQQAKLPPPRPAPASDRLPPPSSPPLSRSVAAAMRAPAVEASRVALPPPGALPRLETTRPAVLSANPEHSAPRKGTSAVWIALGAGIGLGGLMTAVVLQAGSTHAVQASAALRPMPSITAASVGGGEPVAAPARASDPSKKAISNASLEAVEPPGSAQPAAAPQVDPSARRTADRGGDPPSSPQTSPLGTTGHTTVAEPPADRAGASAPATQGKSAAPAASDQSLEALMKRAVGIAAQPAAAPPSSLAVGADPAPVAAAGNLPAKPALGAVQGAVGTVLPAARYCLGPDDPISHATITFKADGSVQNVTVAGPAAGQPAESCIRGRLMTARVPPFSSPTFTWTITVRPAN
jgi:hypothetical protein